MEEARAKLIQLIDNKADYNDIVAQSQLLDGYIVDYYRKEGQAL